MTLLGSGALAAKNGPAFSLQPVRHDPQRPETKSYFVYNGAASLRIEDEVLVRNSGTEAGTVRLYAVDGGTAATSGTVYLEKIAPRIDVGAWIDLSMQEMTLAPGEARQVPFTVMIPADAAAGQHLGGLAAEEVVPTSGTNNDKVRVNVQTRIVTAVQVNLPGPVVEKIAIDGVTAGGNQGYQQLMLALRNEGSMMVQPAGKVIITDSQGRTIQNLDLKLDLFVPRTAIQYPVDVQKQALGPGRYHAKVDLTYGTSGVTHYEGDFDITAAQIAQAFPSSASLAPPPVVAAASTVPAVTISTAPAQWPLFAGGAMLLVLALAGGIFLGRRGRTVDAAK